MPGGFRLSNLPKEVRVNQSAVPIFTSAGDPNMALTNKLTDICAIEFTNGTGSTISATVTDGNNSAIANLSAYAISPNQPFNLQFRVPVRCNSGVKVYTTSAGLYFSLVGYRVMDFSSSTP